MTDFKTTIHRFLCQLPGIRQRDYCRRGVECGGTEFRQILYSISLRCWPSMCCSMSTTVASYLISSLFVMSATKSVTLRLTTPIGTFILTEPFSSLRRDPKRRICHSSIISLERITKVDIISVYATFCQFSGHNFARNVMARKLFPPNRLLLTTA